MKNAFHMSTTTSLLSIAVTAIAISGCAGMEPAPPQPIRPVITCADCKGLEYYGPQMPPAPDARVQMASVIVDGVKSVLGIGAAAYTATNVASTIANAGTVAFGTNNTTTTSTTSSSQSAPIVTTQKEVVTVNPEVIQVPTTIVRPEVVEPVIVR